MDCLVYRKLQSMDKVTLVLGNNTSDTADKCQDLAKVNNQPCHGLIEHWPQELQPGWYYTDVGTIGASNLHDICKQVDNLWLVHQKPADYTDIEEYKQAFSIYRYYAQLKCYDNRLHVVGWHDYNQGLHWKSFAQQLKFDPGTVTGTSDFWSTVADNNWNYIETNILLHFGEIASDLPTEKMLDKFESTLDQLTKKIQQNNNRFLIIRTGAHESYHAEISQILSQHREFVLLHPDCFSDTCKNWCDVMTKQLTWHWNTIY